MRNPCRPLLLAASLVSLGGPLNAQASPDPEKVIRDLGLVIPDAGAPVANYVRAVRTGNLIFLAGHGECGGMRMTGKVGAGVTVDSAYASAARVALCLLGTLKAELGDLRKVRRVVKLTGMVNAAPDFTGHPQVINGASDLLVKVFGDRGRHARAAVGMASLPLDMTVEIDMVVEVEPER
jgi:enamine deaminase RidA (YjgF/YER057c/UK114 family)